MRRSVKAWAVALAVLLVGDALAPLAQATQTAQVWEQRRRALPPSTAYASLPPALAAPLAVPSAIRHDAPRIASSASPDLNRVVAALPASSGDVRDIVRRDGARVTVVHIQDIHANAEAQENIRAAVASVLSKTPAALVAVEGAFTPVDLSRVRAYPRKDTVRRAADRLLQDHSISGAVRAAMDAPEGVVVAGIDDAALHATNRDAYLSSLPALQRARDGLERARIRIAGDKARLFSPELARFDAAVESYRDGRVPITRHVRDLSRFSDSFAPSLQTFLAAAEIEDGLDFARVESERGRVLAKLVATLPAAALRELLERGTAYRAGEIRHAQFYGYLSGLCRRHGVDLRSHPAMDDYVRYVLLSDAVDASRLLNDVEAAEREVYARLAETGPQRAVVEESRRFHLTKKLLDFALTNDEWRLLKELPAAGFPELPADSLRSFLAFYETADARDEAMAARFLDEVNRSSARTAVLVTGGFHSRGIREKLARKGVQIVGFVPALSQVDAENGSAYLSVFSREHTPLDRLFEGPRLFLAPNPANLNPLPVLAAALDHAEGPQAAADALAPGRYNIDLVAGDDTGAVIDVTNNETRESQRVTVRFDAEAIRAVVSTARTTGARLLAGIQSRFRLSQDARIRLALLRDAPRRVVDGVVNYVTEPRLGQRGILLGFAALLLANTVLLAKPAGTEEPPEPAAIVRVVDERDQAAPGSVIDHPVSAQRPASASPARSRQPTLPAAAAAQRRQALRDLRREVESARADDAARVEAARTAVEKIRAAIRSLEQSVSDRQDAITRAKESLDRLEKQLQDVQDRQASPAFKTAPPIAEIQAASAEFSASDWAARADDVAAMRASVVASGAPGTEADGAIVARLDKAEAALRSLASAAEDFRKIGSEPGSTMSPEAAEAYGASVEAAQTAVETASSVPVWVREAEDAAIGLGAVPDDAREEFSGRAGRAADAAAPERLARLTEAIAKLSSAMINIDSLQAEEAELAKRAKDLQRQIDLLSRRVSSLNSERYYRIDGGALADEIDRVAGTGTVADMAREANFRLHSLHPAGGTWGTALETIAIALTNISTAQDQLRDDTLTPEEHLTALRVAVRSVMEIRRATPAFNQLLNPEYGDELNRLPRDPDLLTPDARRSYEAFRARLIAESPDNRALSDREALAQWYGRFIRQDVGAGFPSVSLERLIVAAQTAITNGLNLRSQAEAAGTAAERSAAGREEARDEANRMRREAESLEKLAAEIRADAERARQLAPNTRVITPDFRPMKDRSSRVAAAVEAVNARPIVFVGEAGEELHRLMNQVGEDARRMSLDEVSDADAASARENVARLIRRLDDFVNPAVVKGRDGALRDDDVSALTTMMREVVDTGIVWLAGLADERLRAGVTGDDTYEDRLIRASVAIYGAPVDARAAMKNLEQMRKNSRWGILDILEGINVFMGLMNLQQNFDTFMGKKNPFTFTTEYFPHPYEPPIVTEHAFLPAAKGPTLLLGSANAFVNANGAVAELKLALSGDSPDRAIPYFVTTLFPEAFNRSVWEVVDAGGSDEPGYIYYRTTGFAIRTRIGSRSEGRMTWRAVSDRSQALNRLYRVRNGVIEVMASGKDRADLEQRINHLVRAAQAINHVMAFAGGLRAKVVSPTPTAIARVNAAMAIINTVDGILELIDKAKFKSTLRSANGGWVTSPDPNFSATMTLVYPDGTRVEMGALRENGALLVHRDNVWEAPDGTPVYRTGRGRLKIALNIFRLSLRIWRSAERFQESIREGEKAVGLYTEDDGVFVRRRPDSAPVTVVARDGGLQLRTMVFGRPVHYWLGVPAHDVPVDGQLVTARPYYAIEDDGTPGALLGVLIGDVPLQVGNTISHRSIYSYLGSLPQKLQGMLVQLGVDEWYELNPLEARFSRPGIPAYPGDGWVVDIDGVQRYAGKNGAGESATLFMRWTDSEGVFVLDMEKEILYRYTAAPSGDMILSAVLGVSLPSLARTRERESVEGQWTRDPARRQPRPTDIRLRGFGPNVSAWLDSGTGTMYVSAPKGTVIDGVAFAEGGTYRYEVGGQGVRGAQEALTHPFYRRQPLPLAPDINAIAGEGATRNVRRRGDGSQETWIAVSRFYRDAKSGEQREIEEVYVEYTAAGRRRVDRVVASSHGRLYDAATGDLPRPWERRLVHPEGLAWVGAPVPPSIRPHVPDGVAGAEIAVDARGQFHLRVNMPDGRTFVFAAGVSPEQLRANASGIAIGRRDSLVPLPDGVPDAVVQSLPAFRTGDIVRGDDGRWYSRLRTVGGVEVRMEQLANGRYVVMEAGELARLKEELVRRGLVVVSGGEPMPFGGVLVDSILGFQAGRSSPSVIVLVVRKGGPFVHPETPDAAPVDLKDGQVLLLEPGVAPTLERSERLASPIPILDRVFVSPSDLSRLSATPVRPGGEGRLPAALGAGAESIRGTWLTRDRAVDGRAETTETYFHARDGGVIVDPVTGRRTRVEPGSVWIVERTPESARSYLNFNRGRTPAWILRIGPAETRAGGVPFSLPGKDRPIPGRIFMPAADSGAPLFVVDGAAGERFAFDDAILGSVFLSAGDNLVLQWPAGFQAASLEAQGQSERLYLPSIVGRAQMAAEYEGLPSPDRTPRRLVRGRAPDGLVPGIPAGVTLDVWLDPDHADGPMIVEVAEAPAGVAWQHPQLGVQVPLTAGATFVRVPTVTEMRAELQRQRDAEGPYLVETPWDADSTMLNARRRFDERRDAAANWRRANGKTDRWAFETRVGGLRATVVEDIGNPDSAWLRPTLDFVLFHEAGVVDGTAVRPGVVYRRRAGLRSAERHLDRLERHWGVGYPVAPAGSDLAPITFERPALTGQRYLHETRPFLDDGRPNLVESGPQSRAVQVVRRGGVVYVVEGRAPSPDVRATIFSLSDGSPTEIRTRNYATPTFGGLVQARTLLPARRAAVQGRIRELTGGIYDLAPDTLVRLGTNGRPEAVVMPGLPATEWTEARTSGLGMIQMDAGSHRVRLEGTPARRSYSGWIGIGDEPGFLTLAQVQANILPANGIDGSGGWILVNQRNQRIGVVIFGDKAPKEPIGGLAAVYDLATRGASVVEGDRFDVPALSGITRVDALSPAQRRQLREAMLGTAAGRREPHPGMLVRLAPDGTPIAVVVPRAEARDWVAMRTRGYGYIQMDAGAHDVELNGVRGSRRLAGWVAVGRRPGDLTPEQVSRNLAPANGRDGRAGWILVDRNGRRIGVYVQGRLKLPPRPDFVVPVERPGARTRDTGARVGSTRPTVAPGETISSIQPRDLTPAIESRLRPVVRLVEDGKPGRWAWAAVIDGAWREFRRDPSAPGQWIADAASPPLRVVGTPTAEIHPRGLVDADGRVTAIVGSARDRRTKETRPAAAGSRSPWAVRRVMFRSTDNSSHVSLHNPLSNENVVDSYFGRYPSYRTYWNVDDRGRPIEVSRLIYRVAGTGDARRPVPVRKLDRDPVSGRWFHMEDYELDTGETFRYPANSPARGQTVKGEILIAYKPGTREVISRTFHASDDGRVIWQTVETMMTLTFYDATGRRSQQWTYDLNPAIREYRGGRIVPRSSLDNLDNLAPISRVPLTEPSDARDGERAARLAAASADGTAVDVARPTRTDGSSARSNGDRRNPLAAFLALLGFGGFAGVVTARRRGAAGAGDDAAAASPGEGSAAGPEEDLARRLVRSIVLLSQVPADTASDEERREVLGALEDLFEGAPLDQGLAEADGRVDAVLNAFRGVGVDRRAFRDAYRAEVSRQFGRPIPLDEALGIAHGLALRGVETTPLGDLMPGDLPQGAAAVVIVTEAMKPGLARLMGAIPTSAEGRRVVFVAENDDVRLAVESAASGRSDVTVLDGARAFSGSTSDRTRSLRLSELEGVLAGGLPDRFFDSISAITFISPDGLPIDTDFDASEAGVLRELLRQAAFVLINEQLEAAALTFGTLESIGTLARVISSQA